MNKKCKICNKELKVSSKNIGNIKNSTSLLDSEEGVYFEDGNCWFCNGCWKEMNSEIKIDYKKFL